MTDESWYTALENTHEAVLAYARIELKGLTRRVIYRLQRINASGIYGDDYAYKSLWDERCHEVQEGPHDQLDSAWTQILCPIVDDVMVCRLRGRSVFQKGHVSQPIHTTVLRGNR